MRSVFLYAMAAGVRHWIREEEEAGRLKAASCNPLWDAVLQDRYEGLVEFDSKSWAKDWLKLTKEPRLGMRFNLVEDAVIVAPPKH